MKTRKNNKNKTKQKEHKIVLKKKIKTRNNKKNRKTVSIKKVQKGGWERPYDPSRDLPPHLRGNGMFNKNISFIKQQKEEKEFRLEKKRNTYKYIHDNKNRLKAKKFKEYKNIAEDIAEKGQLVPDNLLTFFKKQSQLYNSRINTFLKSTKAVSREIEKSGLNKDDRLNFDKYKGSVRPETEYTVDFNPILFEPGDLMFVTQAYRDLMKPGDIGVLYPLYYDKCIRERHKLPPVVKDIFKKYPLRDDLSENEQFEFYKFIYDELMKDLFESDKLKYDELNNAKKDTLEYYKLIYDQFKNEPIKSDEMDEELKEGEVIARHHGKVTEGEFKGEKVLLCHANIRGIIYEVTVSSTGIQQQFNEIGPRAYLARKYHDFEPPLPILLKNEDLYDEKGIKLLNSNVVINIDKVPSRSNSNLGGNWSRHDNR